MSRLLRLLVSLALVSGLLWYAGGLRQVIEPVVRADLGWVVLSFAVIIADRLLMTYKWTLLLSSRNVLLGILPGMKIYCSAMVWGTFLPSTMGADALRLYMTTRRGLSGDVVLASVVVERMLGFIASLCFGIVGLVLLDQRGLLDARYRIVGAVGVGVLAAAVIGFAVSLDPRVSDFFFRRLPARLAAHRFVARLERLHQTYAGFGAGRAILASFFGLTLLEQLVTIVYAWCTAKAVGVDVSFGVMAGVLPLTLLVTRIPVSIDGLGVFEGVFVLLLGLAGVPPAEAISVGVIGRIIQTASWLPWWLAQNLEDRRQSVVPGRT